METRATLATELRTILARPGPVVWEVGCGHGHFLTAYAEAHPGKTCIGIDIASDRVGRALRKSTRARRENLFFLRAEARLFLQTLPAAAQLDEIFILFPDPWPKLRHRKHRILQAQFLADAANHAAPDGRLYFRTDFRPYFEDAQQALQKHADWQLIEAPWPFEFATVFQSRAETYHSLIAQRRPLKRADH
ncbi:MAG TPA: tRNA (guanosine(46)-N7)-methyltransferase TrmB [Opitutaceae bacterium]|nr:tRNA (guanosine(46)-N7)-methyltransferase TrmB [Opitutaceae bacterium]